MAVCFRFTDRSASSPQIVTKSEDVCFFEGKSFGGKIYVGGGGATGGVTGGVTGGATGGATGGVTGGATGGTMGGVVETPDSGVSTNVGSEKQS